MRLPRLFLASLACGCSCLNNAPLLRLSNAITCACTALSADDWPEPEDAAWACAQAIAALDDGDVSTALELPAQGEYSFAADVEFDRRFSVVEPLAYEGDACAMQTTGALF